MLTQLYIRRYIIVAKAFSFALLLVFRGFPTLTLQDALSSHDAQTGIAIS